MSTNSRKSPSVWELSKKFDLKLVKPNIWPSHSRVRKSSGKVNIRSGYRAERTACTLRSKCPLFVQIAFLEKVDEARTHRSITPVIIKRHVDPEILAL